MTLHRNTPPGAGAAPGETFRRWSLDLFAALSSGGPDGEVRGAIERLLVERFEQDMRDLARRLRAELPAWQEAARQLECLMGSEVLQVPEPTRLLHEQLAARARQAASLLVVLEKLGRSDDQPLPLAPPRALAAPAPEAVPPPRAGARALPAPAPRAAERPAASTPPPSPRATPQRPPRDPPRAKEETRREGPALRTRTEEVPAKKGTQPETSVPVTCPECGAAGHVRWDRLGHVLTCRGCSRLFRVDQGGRLTEVVRGPDGRWKERRHRAAGRLRALWLLPVAVVLAFAFIGAWDWRHRRAQAARNELPRGLEERAELLGRAWMKKDIPLMRRLTVTTHERILYSWFVRHQPPAGDGPPTVQVVDRKDRAAQVVVRAPGGAAGRPVELRLFWEQRADAWYFVPPPR
jgi:hypothetical protein